MRPRTPLLAALALLLAVPALSAPGSAQVEGEVDARLFRQPDVSETQITFVYGNDVWVAPKEGGTAHRLSSPDGREAFPRFSPDGGTIAFSGNYDGNVDVYTIPSGGGVPTRVTHHPEADRMVDWYPDGDSLFYASPMASGRERYSQFWATSPEGGMPDELPVAYGEMGAVSPDGSTLAFTPETRLFRTWKRYRGGAAADIWLFDLEDGTVERVTDHAANDEMPMWADGTLYFLSDRGPEKRYNVWAHDLETGEKRQVTEFADVDVHVPAIGPSDVVFEAGGDLWLMDLGTEELTRVDVDVVTDRPAVRPRTVDVGDEIRHMDVSPSGARALFGARGEVFTVPEERGPVRRLTGTSGAAERYPAWSPDGEKVAWFGDASGEYELHVHRVGGGGGGDAGALGSTDRVTSLGPGYRYTPHWGPDSRRVVFVDDTKTVRMVDVESGEVTEIDRLLWPFHGGLAAFEVSWSPDGRWIAYDRGLENGHAAVFLYDTESGERHRVTSEFYDNSGPVFGVEGKYLFLETGRHHEPAYSDLDNSWIYANTTRIAAVPLRDDVESPLHPRSDEETGDGEGEEGDDGDDGDGAPGGNGDAGGPEAAGGQEADGGGPDRVEIDLEGFEQRMVLLPAEAGNYGRLAAVEGMVLYHRAPRTGSGDEEAPLVAFDLEEREEVTILADVDAFRLAASGGKLLVEKDGRYDIVEVAPEQEMGSPLDTGGMTAEIDPREEWEQIFADAWRLNRDYFYDPDLHGVDWEAMRERYGALVDDAATREDVNFAIGELIAELNASHTYRGGGDTETPERRQVGLLGVDWSLENGAYRIERVLEGAPWDVEARSPLREPGVDVAEGDYVLAVNGTPVDTDEDPWAALEGLAGQTVELTVDDRPSMDGARTVLVETLASDDRLRLLDWVNRNRERVEETSDGRVGYVYVPNTATGGQTELVRQFRGQVQKDALIIDERFNSGGQLADRFLELLDRPMFSWIAPRHGAVQPSPPVAHTGPQAMLINGWSGSGGDAFPWYFDTADRGPIVGTRTWGGLIGPAVGHQLVDGGVVVVPPARLYGPDGEWFAEGHGVEPDIRVENDPASMAAGEDPQLERAVDEMLRALEEQGPPTRPERPPYVDRVPEGRGDGGGGGR